MAAFEDSAAFASLANDLHSEQDEHTTADTIVQRMAELVPDADMVSLTVRLRGAHVTLASTDDVASAADDLQYALNEGPCVQTADGASDQTWLRAGELRGDPRWPRWGPRAADLGITSLLSIQLLDRNRPLGALNLYSRTPSGFMNRDAIDMALIYAIHAANALAAARQVTSLETALTSRHTIGMAQGIVMERFDLDEHASFELLRRLASTTETKLRDVATHIVTTRTIPTTGDGDDPRDA